MKIGVTGNVGKYGTRVAELARTIEALGFESVWTGEHIIVPVNIANPVRNGIPLPESYKNMPDLFVTLSVIAGATTTLKLGSNICLVPQRNPLTLAKEVATLDFISGGRVVLGIGNGWIEEEAAIFGFDFKDRVRRTNEFVEAMKVLWTEDKPSFSGEFVNFPEVYSDPKPCQKPHPPVVLGAGDTNIDNSRILKRIAERFNGWTPLNMTPAQMKEQLGQLKELCEVNGRDYSAMDISVIVLSTAFGIDVADPSPGKNLNQAQDLVAQYEEAGVGRLIILPLSLSQVHEMDESAFEIVAKGFGLA